MNESRAARHQRLRRRTRAAGVAGGGILLAGLSLTPAGSLVERWSRALASGLPPVLSDVAALVMFVTMVVLLWEAALLPAMIAGGAEFDRRSKPGAEGRSLRTALLAAVVAVPVAVVVAALIQAAVRVGGGSWWLVAAALLVAALAAAQHLAPQMLARWSGARPVVRPDLVERLGVLSRQIKVPIESIDQLPAGAAATRTALVAGTGSSRRVFIASELVQDWSDEEIAIVVAHEFAHHAHHDLWRTLAVDAFILSAGFWLADRLAASGWMPVPPGSLAALPFVALIVAGVFVVATPLRNAISRRQERRADAFALRMTGGVDAFRTALRRLAATHLAEERPTMLTRWLYHRHPPVAERLATADSFRSTSRPR